MCVSLESINVEVLARGKKNLQTRGTCLFHFLVLFPSLYEPYAAQAILTIMYIYNKKTLREFALMLMHLASTWILGPKFINYLGILSGLFF